MAAFPWKARAKQAAVWVGAVLAYAVVLYGLFYVGLRPVADFWVSTIFKNAPEPLDEELPVTVTAFRPAANVVSTIGGKGEGLNCSMPWGIDLAFAKRNNREEATIPVRQRFRQACVFHDLCYRHGLATYGYSQNDCDELLQEHALRICISISPGLTLSECQIDAKKVAAGVKIGGFNSYQGWGNSTHFEFDPNPYRAMRFSVVRAVDHPFKKNLSSKLADEPDQLLMKFDVLRAGVRLRCINCAGRQPHDEELALAKASNLTGLMRSRNMNAEREVWLPLSRLFAAPHIMSDEAGGQVLVWVTRQSLANTDSCIVAIEPGNLLTDTRPRDEGCRRGANERVSLTQVDLLSSAPQLSNLQAPGIVVTGLTAQNTGRLEICVSHNVRSSPSDTHKKCHVLRDKTGGAISGSDRLESFQNFPIIRGGNHIYLSRTLPRKGRTESVDTGRVLAFDVSHDHMPSSVKPPSPIVLRNRRFEISDAYDPMLPITFDPSDMRMISAKLKRSWWASWLGTSEGVLEFYEIDLKAADDEPFQVSGAINAADPGKVIKPRLVQLQDASGSAGLELHGSWARRPIQVIEAGTGPGRATQLVLSRSAMLPRREEAPVVYASETKTEAPRRQATRSTLSRDVVENTRFQIAIFERPAAETKAQSPFKLVRGLTCHVSYTVLRLDEDRVKPCQRTVSMVGTERATPATMLRGAQLLSGRFTKGNDLPLALFDACMPTQPIMISAGSAIAPPDRNLRREVLCVPVKEAKELAAPLVEALGH